MEENKTNVEIPKHVNQVVAFRNPMCDEVIMMLYQNYPTAQFAGDAMIPGTDKHMVCSVVMNTANARALIETLEHTIQDGEEVGIQDMQEALK